MCSPDDSFGLRSGCGTGSAIVGLPECLDRIKNLTFLNIIVLNVNKWGFGVLGFWGDRKSVV